MEKKIGDKYGRLTIIEDLGRLTGSKGGPKHRFFLCKCDCGNIKKVDVNALGRNTLSCGCLRMENFQRPKSTRKPGDRVGRLTIIEDLGMQKRGIATTKSRYFLCRCDCGNTIEVLGNSLNGNTSSCGCLHTEVCSNPIPSGTVFGRLTVLERDEGALRDPNRRGIWYRCECECGKTVTEFGAALRSGHVTSCGCLKRESAKTAMANAHGKFVEKNHVEGTSICAIATTKLRKDNKSGIRGVYRCERAGKWIAHIGFKGKRYNLGHFSNIDDAAKARKDAEDRLYGEFLKWYYSGKR